MRTLRHFTFIARFVLASMVLALGVAVASPIVKPLKGVVVCSATGGMKVLVTQDDGSTAETGNTGMDCPLCAITGAPPPPAQVQAVPSQPQGYALQSMLSGHIAARVAAPLPARGPPAP